MANETADLPSLQPSCSPVNSDSPTRWQKLRVSVQTRSLLPLNLNAAVIPAFAGRQAAHMHNSALNRFATVSKPRQPANLLLHGATANDRARAALLFQPEVEPTLLDSVEADIQVEAVLRKATARAACLAGLPPERPAAAPALPVPTRTQSPHRGLGHQVP